MLLINHREQAQPGACEIPERRIALQNISIETNLIC